MNQIVLGVGDLGATSEPGAKIKTYALGSCVALVLLDPKTHTIGMAHIALPESTISPTQAKEKPGRFADTALPALIDAMAKAGFRGELKSLIVKMCGGAQVLDPNGIFNIGKRNVLAIKKALWQRGMGAVAEDVGGNISRTVTVDVATGVLLIESHVRETMKL